MLRRTMQIPIWPRCCGFRFYFWEGQRENQLFLEPWAAGFWLQFSFLPWAESGLGHPCWGGSTVPATTLLSTCPAVSAGKLSLSPLLQVSPAVVGAGWDPELGDFPAKLCLSPDLKQQLVVPCPCCPHRAKLWGHRHFPHLAWDTVPGIKSGLYFGGKKWACSVCAQQECLGEPTGWARPSWGSTLTSLDFHIFPSANLICSRLKAKRG